MSFRAYAPNPILQRLREANESVMAPNLKNNALEATILPREEEYLIVGYGNLSVPHSYAQEPHDARQLRSRRRSSAAGRFQPQADIKRTSRHSDSEVSTTKTIALASNSSPESSQDEASTPKIEVSPPATPPPACFLTARPVFIGNDSWDDDTQDAVIVHAKRARFETPRKIRLPPRNQ
ncbi:hypothetical protein M422DRAFT_65374 [Sphaerobolus stellatus SS14]|nr:hypothetical protein M422DRAFT_65374 [Sphaerobolus stellatus SS14]